MKMRDLEAKTGVNREAIRFYIREGLLPEPERPRRNVAIYSDVHVQGIEMIRSLQKDPHLTLGMIKRIMHGEPVSVSTIAGYSHRFGSLLAHRMRQPIDSELIPVDQIVEHRPLAKRYIEAFNKSGVIEKITVEQRDYLDALDARIVSIWVDARSRGYDEALGFGPHGILPFAEAMDALAPVVMTRFLDQINGQIDETAAAHLAQVGIEVANALLPLLFTRAMFREAIKRSEEQETSTL